MGGRLPEAADNEDTAVVHGADSEHLRSIGAHRQLREVPVVGERLEDTWHWRPNGPFLRADVVTDASIRRRFDELAAWAVRRPLPYDIALDEIAAHLWALVLTNPEYAAPA